MTTIIKQDDLITSIKDALQFISYYHPQDFIQAMSRAYDREENQAAKDAIAQILTLACVRKVIVQFAKILVLLTFSLKWA
ncbi:Fumarate hydratase (Fumerase) [compost metagenome]